MAAIANDYDTIAYKAATAVTYAGTLCKKTANAREMDTTGAGDKADGYYVTDTKDIDGVAQAGVYCGVHALSNGKKFRAVLLATNAEIAIGDELETTAGGTVDKKDGAGSVIGVAEEAVSASAGAGATILVRVRQYTASA